MVEVQSLRKEYPGQLALDDVSFTLSAGRIVGYFGANGAGKSTTVKVLAGLLSPRCGRIVFEGSDVTRDLRPLKRVAGYVPEEQHLYDWLTGREHLELLGRLRGLPHAKVEERAERFLCLFGLTGAADSRLSSYSKGMRQRIAIAAALIHDPRLLILDEPFSGLDLESSLVFARVLRLLAGRGRAILYCCHFMSIADEICDDAIFLKRGAVVACGAAALLKRQGDCQSLGGLLAASVLSTDPDRAAARIAEAIAL